MEGDRFIVNISFELPWDVSGELESLASYTLKSYEEVFKDALLNVVERFLEPYSLFGKASEAREIIDRILDGVKINLKSAKDYDKWLSPLYDMKYIKLDYNLAVKLLGDEIKRIEAIYDSSFYVYENGWVYKCVDHLSVLPIYRIFDIKETNLEEFAKKYNLEILGPGKCCGGSFLERIPELEEG